MWPPLCREGQVEETRRQVEVKPSSSKYSRKWNTFKTDQNRIVVLLLPPAPSLQLLTAEVGCYCLCPSPTCSQRRIGMQSEMSGKWQVGGGQYVEMWRAGCLHLFTVPFKLPFQVTSPVILMAGLTHTFKYTL